MRTISLLLVFLFTLNAAWSQTEKKVVVEHFTNTLCGICASKNPAFYAILDNNPEVLHVSYHPSSPYAACIFSQHNVEENDARTNYYGVYGGTPRAVLQGVALAPSSPLVSQAQLDSKAGELSDFSIQVQHQPGGSDSVSTVITVKRISGSGQESMRLSAVLAERSISYSAPNGETQHRNVFRKTLVEEIFSLSNVNDSTVISKKYLPHADWVKDEIMVVAILQDVADKAVLQAAGSGQSTSIKQINRAEDLSSAFYPNPVTSVVNFPAETGLRYEKVRLLTIFGDVIAESDPIGPIDMRSLAPGYYFLFFTDSSGNSFSAKVVKSGN